VPPPLEVPVPVHLAAEVGATPPDLISTILQWGVPGVMLVLLLMGWLIPRGAHEQMKADRDKWQEAFEKEREAHDATRDALADASRSASAAVETARTTAGILSTLGHTTRPGGV
jgi:hypothetical protein